MVEQANGQRHEVTPDALRGGSEIWPLPKLDALKILARVKTGEEIGWSDFNQVAQFLTDRRLVGTQIEIEGRPKVKWGYTPEDLLVINFVRESKGKRFGYDDPLKELQISELLQGERLEILKKLNAGYSR